MLLNVRFYTPQSPLCFAGQALLLRKSQPAAVRNLAMHSLVTAPLKYGSQGCNPSVIIFSLMVLLIDTFYLDTVKISNTYSTCDTLQLLPPIQQGEAGHIATQYCSPMQPKVGRRPGGVYCT